MYLVRLEQVRLSRLDENETGGGLVAPVSPGEGHP
jgi:hypothetical protein